MGLEIGEYINSLEPSNPAGIDQLSQADDHLRLIKKCLQQTFQSNDTNGLDGPVTTTKEELNALIGITGNVQDLINAVIPSGTAMVFYQEAAPIGWTEMALPLSNNMLRVVTELSTEGGKAGGTDSPILMDKVPAHTHGTDDPGQHAHGEYRPTFAATRDGGVLSTGIGETYVPSGLAGEHTHTTNSQSPTAANWTPLYASVIICTKN